MILIYTHICNKKFLDNVILSFFLKKYNTKLKNNGYITGI